MLAEPAEACDLSNGCAGGIRRVGVTSRTGRQPAVLEAAAGQTAANASEGRGRHRETRHTETSEDQGEQGVGRGFAAHSHVLVAPVGG